MKSDKLMEPIKPRNLTTVLRSQLRVHLRIELVPRELCELRVAGRELLAAEEQHGKGAGTHCWQLGATPPCLGIS